MAATVAPAGKAKKEAEVHPLENKWTIWYLESPAKKKDWLSAMKRVGDFDSVEGFFQYYHNMPKPSDLRDGADYYVFKYGIDPVWEDIVNAEGGGFAITMPPAMASKAYGFLALALVGENLDRDFDGVVGVRLCKRQRGKNPGDKVEVWVRRLPTSYIRSIAIEVFRVLKELEDQRFKISKDVELKFDDRIKASNRALKFSASVLDEAD